MDRKEVIEFCQRKKIENAFVQECIAEFVEGHVQQFGDIVSQEELFSRLEDNLDKVTFAESKGNELGEYIGRTDDDVDQNEIFIYAKESNLRLSEEEEKVIEIYTKEDREKALANVEENRERTKKVIFHELTHCAYTIKDKYGVGEDHIFGSYGKDIVKNIYTLAGGNDTFMEGIVSYIASRVEGKESTVEQSYPLEKQAIEMLAETVGEEKLIEAAWKSDENILKGAYAESMRGKTDSPEESYAQFCTQMKKLIMERNKVDKKPGEAILEDMKKILSGEKLETKEIKPLQEKTWMPNEAKKSGLEDAKGANIREGLLHQVTQYVRQKVINIKNRDAQDKEEERG